MQESSAPRKVEKSICPSCGAPNQCGAESGSDTCWCFALPHVLPLASSADASCFCPACAERRLAEGRPRKPGMD